MTMAEHVSSQDEVFDSIDLSKELSSTHLSEEASKDYTPDRLLDELSFPSSHTPVYQDRDASRNYDQFFEEVSLDLPRESVMAPSSSKIMKFMPRRANSSAATQPEMSITPSDISGPFYSISDVLDDTSSTTAAAAAAAAAVAAAGRDSNADHLNNLNSRAARRNVNEAEVIVTSGGTSIGPVPRRST